MSQASRSVDIPSLGFKKSPNHFALLQNTASIAGVDPRNYDAVFFAGGQSPMVTFRRNEKLQRFVAAFYEDGKVTALVCQCDLPAAGAEALER